MSTKNTQKDVQNLSWIQRCEQSFADSLEKVAEELFERKNLHIVLLTGPTCAGKTTTANLLERYFNERGRRILTVSIDDFYYDRSYLEQVSEKKGLEDVDYESIDTLDFKALQIFTEEIIHSSEVHSPIFDFKTGCRTGYRSIQIQPGDVFLFEGIQVLYPEIMKLFAPYGVASIYIDPGRDLVFGNVRFSPNDIRLMRRIVRDAEFRNTPPEETFDIWDSVRRNEDNNIFPYAHTCEFRIHSAMDYELGILAPHLNRLLSSMPANSPFRKDAEVILSKLQGVEPISDSLIQSGMLYKEFV